METKEWNTDAISELPHYSRWYKLESKNRWEPANPSGWEESQGEYVWNVDVFQQNKVRLNEEFAVLDTFDDRERKMYQIAANKHRPSYFLVGKNGKLVSEYGAEIATNAWLKMYELCRYIDPMVAKIKSPPRKKAKSSLQEAMRTSSSNKTLRSLHLAEAPGNFMLAINHWLYSNYPGVSWKWTATSYRDPYESMFASQTGKRTGYLTDRYGIIRQHPNQWFFGADSDGDITSPNNIKSLSMLDKFDFATGDVKYIAPDMDFSEEERINIPVVFGQFISSIWNLKKDGVIINKMFSFNEPPTICMFVLMAYFFKEFKIVIPPSSREANSEIYIVSIGYKNNCTATVKKHLIEYMETIRFLNTGEPVPPLFVQEDIPDDFIQQLESISTQIADSRIEALHSNLDIMRQIAEKGEDEVWQECFGYYESKANEWISNNHIVELGDGARMIQG